MNSLGLVHYFAEPFKWGAKRLNTDHIINNSTQSGVSLSEALDNVEGGGGSSGFPDGDLTQAGIYFANDVDTGFNLSADGIINAISGGVSTVSISSASGCVIEGPLSISGAFKVNTSIGDKKILQSDSSGNFNPITIQSALISPIPGASESICAGGTSQANSTVVGYFSYAESDGVAIGNGAQTTDTRGVAVGMTSASGEDAVCVGNTSSALTNGVAIGSESSAQFGSISIGYNSDASPVGIAIGLSSTAELNGICLGSNLTATPGQLAIGLGSGGNNIKTDLSFENSTPHTNLAGYLPLTLNGSDFYIQLWN